MRKLTVMTSSCLATKLHLQECHRALNQASAQMLFSQCTDNVRMVAASCLGKSSKLHQHLLSCCLFVSKSHLDEAWSNRKQALQASTWDACNGWLWSLILPLDKATGSPTANHSGSETHSSASAGDASVVFLGSCCVPGSLASDASFGAVSACLTRPCWAALRAMPVAGNGRYCPMRTPKATRLEPKQLMQHPPQSCAPSCD